MPSRNWTYCPALPTSIALRREYAKACRAVIATACTRIGKWETSAEKRKVTSEGKQKAEDDRGREGDGGGRRQSAERGAQSGGGGEGGAREEKKEASGRVGRKGRAIEC